MLIFNLDKAVLGNHLHVRRFHSIESFADLSELLLNLIFQVMQLLFENTCLLEPLRELCHRLVFQRPIKTSKSLASLRHALNEVLRRPFPKHLVLLIKLKNSETTIA